MPRGVTDCAGGDWVAEKESLCKASISKIQIVTTGDRAK